MQDTHWHQQCYHLSTGDRGNKNAESPTQAVFIDFKKAFEKERTRRERLKSALYLTLKKRKTFFFGKKLEIFENFFLSKNVAQCRKKSKGGTL